LFGQCREIGAATGGLDQIVGFSAPGQLLVGRQRRVRRRVNRENQNMPHTRHFRLFIISRVPVVILVHLVMRHDDFQFALKHRLGGGLLGDFGAQIGFRYAEGL
jgi:hypothetical protein